MPTFDEEHLPDDPREKPHNTPQPNQPPVARPIASSYGGVNVDSRVFNQPAILSHVEGGQWFVNSFYNHLLNRGCNPEPYSVDLPAVNQQYIRIDKLELRVIRELSRNFVQGANEFEVTGASIVYGGVVPNVHDIIIADIGDGKLGRFNVTSVMPTSYLIAGVYEVEYKLVDYLTPKVQVDLDLKTVERYHYVRDQHNRGHGGILLDQDYQDYQDLLKIKRSLPKEYFREFFSREFQTLLVPSQRETVYDGFAVTFFKRLVDADEHPWVYKINELNIDLGYGGTLFTLWDAALESDESIIDRCSMNVQPVSTSWFSMQALFSSIYYSGIANAMHPVDLQLEIGARPLTIKESFKLSLGPNVTLNRKVRMSEVYSPKTMDINVIGGVEPNEWISEDIFKETYVFSKAFYEGDEGQSALELMFRKAIRGEPISPRKLIKACNDRVLWTSTTRYYYIPVLLYILRTALVNVS